MNVSILTVTWNSADFVLKQISSVLKNTKNLKSEHLIADNNSSDGTITAIRQKFPDLSLQVFSQNIGFGAANNMLAAKAIGKYFLLLNPDVEILDNGIDALFSFAEQNPTAGIVGGLLTTEDGIPKFDALPRRFPKLFDQLVILTKLHHLFPGLLDKYFLKGFDYKKVQTVDSVQGSFMLVSRELFEQLGRLFDPRYFIWFEDVDLCHEAKRLGYEVWYTPSAKAVDFGGRSFSKKKLYWKQLQLVKSMLKYFMKWEEIYSTGLLAIVSPFVLLAVYIHDLFTDYEA